MAKKEKKEKEEIVRDVKVKATQKGYFGGKLRREDDTFKINEKEFSEKWMEKVDGRKKAEKVIPQINPSL